MTLQPVQSFYAQISASRRRSLLLVLILTGLLSVFGFVIGFALTGSWQGGVIAIAVAIAMALLLTSASYFAGDGIVLCIGSTRGKRDERSSLA